MRPSRSSVLTIAAALFLAGCGRLPVSSDPPQASRSPSPSASRSAAPPTASPLPTVGPSATAYVAPARTVFQAPATAQVLVGRLGADGTYEVLGVDFSRADEPMLLRSIPDLEARLPDRLGLARQSPAAMSETGYLVVTVGRVVVDSFRLAVFDLASPTAAPWLIDGTQFRLVGDRLWVIDGESQLDVYDLPSQAPRLVTVPAGRSLVNDDVVRVFLTSAGDAVLLQDRESAGPPFSLLGIDGVERPLGDESFAWTTAREQPFGLDRARIRIGIDCESAEAAYCIDRESGPDTAVAVDGPADVTWIPEFGEDSTAHVGTDGLGVVRAGQTQLMVAFDRRPVRIAGFWSNLAIVPFGDDLSLGAVYVDVDAITQLPLGPESVIELPGDVLLRSLSW